MGIDFQASLRPFKNYEGGTKAVTKNNFKRRLAVQELTSKNKEFLRSQGFKLRK